MMIDWGQGDFEPKILAGDLNEKKNRAGDFAKIKIRIEIMQFQGSSSRLGLSRISLSPGQFFSHSNLQLGFLAQNPPAPGQSPSHHQ